MSSKRPRDGLLSRLGEAARRIVGGGRVEPAAPSDRQRAREPGAIVEDSFRLGLQQMLAEDGGRFQTRLQVISLVEFHDAVGDKWGRLSTKVLMIAESVINLHIGAGNLFGRDGEDTFVLIFRSCPPAEARRRAVTIAQDLGTRLLGSQFESGGAPLALAAEVSLEDGVNPDGSLNRAAIKSAVEEVRSLIAASQPESKPDFVPLPGSSGAPRAPVGDGEIVHSQLPTKPLKLEPVVLPRGMAAPAADPAWTAMEGRARPKSDPAWEALSARKATQPPPEAKVEEGAPPLPADARLSLVWRPTWVADGEAIGAYKSRLRRVDFEGQAPFEGARAYPADDPAAALALDRFAAGQALGDMAAAEKAGNAALLVMPLHWASVSSAQRMAVTAAFAEVSEQARAARLAVELFGIPADVPARELAEVVRALKALAGRVALRTRLGSPRAGLAADCGASLIGVDLAELAAGERTDDSHLLAALAAYRDAAQGAGLGACVWGVRHRKVMVGVVHGGFAMANGPALMKDLPRPAKVLPAPRSRFVQGA